MKRTFSFLRRLFPKPFRDQYGDQMVEYLLRRSTEARARDGRSGAFRFWIKNVLDVLGSAVLEWGSELTKRRHTRRFYATRSRPAIILDDLRQDVRIGTRRLIKNPGFAVVALVILGLGIGANSTMFAVLNAVVLRPLPYPDPDRLVEVWESNPAVGWDFFSFSHPNYLDYRDANSTFDGFAAYTGASFNLTGDGEPMRVGGGRISHELFPLLGVHPLIGRGFTADEDIPGGVGRVVLLSHGLWQRRFGGDDGVLGRTVELNNESYTIVGVMPEGGQWLEYWDIFSPLNAQPERSRNDHRLAVIGRLAPGVSMDQAEADLDAIAVGLAERYPESNHGFDTRLMSLQDSIVGDGTRTALYTLMGAVFFVLLIAVANLTNLLLARAVGRRRELAVSVALGARRPRLVRQLVTESMILAAAGGGVGMLVAWWSLNLFRSIDPGRVPRLNELSLDPTMVGFTVILAVVTGLCAGYLPAWQATRGDVHEALQAGGRGNTGAAGARRLRNALLAAEVAVSVVLLVGAALLMRSFWHVSRIDPGLRSEGVLAASITVPASKFDEPEQDVRFYQDIIREVRRLPGVETAAAISGLPFGSGSTVMDLGIDGIGGPGASQVPSAYWRLITPEYFETLGIPVLQGRKFTDDDDYQSDPLVVIISRTMAERFWPGESAVGKSFRPWGAERLPAEIVGVVGDVRERDLEQDEANIVYLPFYWGSGWSDMHLVVRSAGDPMAVLSGVRAAVSAVESDIPLSNARPLSDAMERTMAPRRFNTALIVSFAVVAIVLAGAGIYGVLAYTVAQRTNELGIRMALGAKPGQVIRMVIGQSMRVVLIGGLLGSVGAVALTRLARGMLFGVSASDPMSAVAAVVFLGTVALLASAIPALRASRVDAVEALRAE